MVNESTIWEGFTLPSKGLVYSKPINPNVELRSMTTAEEMERLSPSETPYKVMSSIIEKCMKEKTVCDRDSMRIAEWGLNDQDCSKVILMKTLISKEIWKI